MGNDHNTRIVYNIWKNQSDKQHISGLDALRTLAIVGVTLFHMFPDTVSGGYLGVSLFFVLTGYLLAYTSETEWMGGKFSVFHYYIKRIKRIYPSLFVVILATIGIYHFLAPKVIEAVQ
jgi:peptidoglycan/LPS O-acetylase OafA/YrhL